MNSKTNRPVDMLYIPLELDGKQVALVQIPLQQRPVFLLKDYGPLSKNTVYVRRGSSTDVAKPDEIARMGHEAATATLRAPKLSAFAVAGAQDQVVDKSISLETTNARIPPDEDFPRYGVTYGGVGLGLRVELPNIGGNENYYVEYAKYMQAIARVKGILFGVKNTGNSVARDVKLVLTINGTLDEFTVCHIDDLPDPPSPDRFHFSALGIRSVHDTPDVFCKRPQERWKVSVMLGKIQAMDMSVSMDLLCVGARQSTALRISAEIFADDLPEPVTEELTLAFSVAQKSFSVSDFVKAKNHDGDS